jgi:hypothetical protein
MQPDLLLAGEGREYSGTSDWSKSGVCPEVLPDLQVAAVNALRAFSGSIQIQWTVTNSGETRNNVKVV